MTQRGVRASTVCTFIIISSSIIVVVVVTANDISCGSGDGVIVHLLSVKHKVTKVNDWNVTVCNLPRRLPELTCHMGSVTWQS